MEETVKAISPQGGSVSKEFNANAISDYRDKTARHAKHAGMMLNRRKCHQCGMAKETTGGKLTVGTSRWNPSVFICADCRGDK